MRRLTISTLGVLQIAIENIPLTGFLSNKVRALLIYLAVEPSRPFPREQLSGLLWPNQSETKARANLRRALANLRQIIDDKNNHFLQINRQTIQFNLSSHVYVDIVHFEKLLNFEETDESQLETAVKLVDGKFLSGFSIKGSIAFEDWVMQKREETQRKLLAGLNRLTSHYEKNQQYETAVQYAWKQIITEPWHEPGQRQLLRLLSKTQQRTLALSHYEQFQKDLRAELGITPEPETQILIQEIRRGQLQKTDSTSDFDLQTIQNPPFVARQKELSQLENYLKVKDFHHSKIALISGEAGSGKTMLMQRFAQKSQQIEPATLCLFGECQAHVGSGIPYHPFRNLLTRAVGDAQSQMQFSGINYEQAERLLAMRSAITTLLQEVAPDLLSLLWNSDEDKQKVSQDVLFQQFCRFFQQLSQLGPLFMLLDDLHWADVSSIDLLLHLQKQLVGYPIILIGTYRPEVINVASFQEKHSHPLKPFLYELNRNNGNVEVPLNQTDGWAFINEYLDLEVNQFDEAFRKKLYQQTRGHALFSVELLAKLKERGDLFQDSNECWNNKSVVRWEQMPDQTEAILAEKMSRLTPLQHQILTIACVQGQTFIAERIAEMMERSTFEIIQNLSEGLQREHQLVQAQAKKWHGNQAISEYRFRHNLIQQYFYGRLDPIELTSLHQMTGETFEKYYQKAEAKIQVHAAQLAFHFDKAQNISKAIDYYEQAGLHAMNLSAHAEAVSHYRKILTFLDEEPNTIPQIQKEIKYQQALGAALLAIKGYSSKEVKEVYNRAFTLSEQIDDRSDLISSLFWLGSYYCVVGQLERAKIIGQEIVKISEQKSDWRPPQNSSTAVVRAAALFYGEIRRSPPPV